MVVLSNWSALQVDTVRSEYSILNVTTILGECVSHGGYCHPVITEFSTPGSLVYLGPIPTLTTPTPQAGVQSFHALAERLTERSGVKQALEHIRH